MDVLNVLHMIGGEGEASYAANSQLQAEAIMKAKPVVTNTIIDLYKNSSSRLLKFADLGCSSGPNSLLAVSEIIDAIYETCQKEGYAPPGLQIYLNDLPGNDFNSIFKYLPVFLNKIRRKGGFESGGCFIAGVPGSYYERLFPDKTLDFVHSSYSLHFLSQVPLRIENNRGNIYIGMTSPTNVPKAYCTKFRKDFTLFLKLRSEEMRPGGRMAITMLGRRTSNPCSEESSYFWDLLAQSLRDLVLQGIVEESKLDSFNLPWYAPSGEEIRTILQEEGSFQLHYLDIFDVSLEAKKELRTEVFVATMRAVAEPMIVSHFGKDIVEQLFSKYTENAAKYLEQEEEFKFATLVMCMTKGN